MTDDSAIAALKEKIDYRLNEHLCEMKPNYDDSIAGFNEAWDIVSKAFATVDLVSQSSCAKEKDELERRIAQLERQLADIHIIVSAMTSAAGRRTDRRLQKIKEIVERHASRPVTAKE